MSTVRDSSSGLDQGSARSALARDAIVSAAAELFASHGYRQTILDDVAAAAGIKKATLYHYIASKAELLTEIYQRILDRIEAAVRPIATMDLSSDERLRRMVHAHIDVVTKERDMLAVAFNEEAELPPALRESIQRRKRAYEKLFEDVIQQGQNEGVLRPMDSRLAVLALLGMCNWMYRWYRPGRFSPAEIAASFMLLLEAGWLAPATSREGAWPRSETVDGAIGDLVSSIDQIDTAVERLRAEVQHAHERLQDGLARPRSNPKP